MISFSSWGHLFQSAAHLMPHLQVQHRAGGTPNGLWTLGPLRQNNTPPVFRVFIFSFLFIISWRRTQRWGFFSLRLSLLSLRWGAIPRLLTPCDFFAQSVHFSPRRVCLTSTFEVPHLDWVTPCDFFSVRPLLPTKGMFNVPPSWDESSCIIWDKFDCSCFDIWQSLIGCCLQTSPHQNQPSKPKVS